MTGGPRDDDERLDRLVATLPSPKPPASLHASIMAQLYAEQRQRQRPSWGIVALAATIAFLAGALGAWVLLGSSGEAPLSAVAPGPQSPTARVESAHLRSDGPAPVRFLYVDHSARRVQLVGDFDGWGEREILLRPTGVPGIFSATVALPRGEHQYMFVLDGERWIADPLAVLERRDGFGRTNSVVEI